MAIPNKTFFGMSTAELQAAFPLQQYHFGKPSGDVFFVHNNGSGGTTGGRSPETAVTTIDAGINLCTANKGHIVYVLPGHAESITAAAGIALDVAGVSIIGCPWAVGRERPVITFTTATGASLDISAADCSIQNLVLVNGIDAQTAMVNVTAADCLIQGCEFLLGDATTQAVLGILTNAAASRMIVRRCHMHGLVTAGVTGAIRFVGGDSIVIEDNYITGAFATTGAVENVTTAATMCVIRRNNIINHTADGNNKVITLVSTTSGSITDNKGGIIDSTCPAPFTAAGAFWGGNHIATNVNVAGTLY